MNDPEDTEATEDLDDLELLRGSDRALATDEYISKVVDSLSDDPSEGCRDEHALPQGRNRGLRPQGQKVAWSSDESEDTYEKLKNRKNTKRKRAITPRQKKNAAGQDQVVGKRPKKNTKQKPAKKARDFDADSDDLMEYTLPDYLQQRKVKFEKRMEKLRESGLKLPPT
ncbi:MAG: hypothetical protein Q9192_008971, partial [Flavoplaca navasiana]